MATDTAKTENTARSWRPEPLPEEGTPGLTQSQKIGTSKGAARVCIWNREMERCGFPIGQPISISSVAGGLLRARAAGGVVWIVPDADGRRKVAKVKNHGNVLPVIDLKTTRALDLSVLGRPGDTVTVDIRPGRITIAQDAISMAEWLRPRR